MTGTGNEYLSSRGRCASKGRVLGVFLALCARAFPPGWRLFLGIRRQRVEKEDPGDQPVQHGGQQERNHEEQSEISEVYRLVESPWHLVSAHD